MRRRQYKLAVLLAGAVLLSGCGKETPNMAGPEQELQEITKEDIPSEAVSEEETQTAEDSSTAGMEDTDGDEPFSEENQNGDAASGVPGDEAAGIEDTEWIMMDNPSLSYYMENWKNPQEFSILLGKEKEEGNDIIDDDRWFSENGLDRPGFPYSDGKYTYETLGYNAFDTYALVISDAVTGEHVATLDFAAYNCVGTVKPGDEDFVFERIIYAAIEGDVLYVATGHNTYAESCPENAYITAIDRKDFHVLWKTQPLTCNSYSFAIVGDYIISGYGFTAEPDSLKVVDKATGVVMQEIPLKSMAEYIIYKQSEGKLYVRTYNTNYEFSIADAH